jgi:AraC-like DNA-binding protein
MTATLVPVSLPGLRVMRATTDAVRVGLKEQHVVARVEHGCSQWWALGKIWRSGPGSILLKQPGDVHRDVTHDGPITFQAILLPAQEFERCRDESTRLAPPLLLPDDERGLSFHRLHDAVTAGADRLALEVALTEAIAAFSALKKARPEHTRPVRRALAYLRERVADTFTLDELALHAGLDKFHLCRAFRAQVGMPPHMYLTHLRIERAKQLLEAGTRASEVAPQVGLYDQSLLNRHFRRIVGTTPGRYGGAFGEE